MQQRIHGLKVFSATKANDREVLGERVTKWIADNPNLEVVDVVITQSSDSEFHCLAITTFYVDKLRLAKEDREKKAA